MKITRTFDGKANLHIWREGDEYFRQKSPVFLKEWTNVMYVVIPKPPIKGVYYCDISKPLDFPDNAFDNVNTYHVFEHLTPHEAENFLAELRRIMKPGGILRLSVPDLERIVREYLYYLEECLKETSWKNVQRYKWTAMEMFDQMVREKAGGLMWETIQSDDCDKEYIREHYSDVFGPFLKGNKEEYQVRSPQKMTLKRIVCGIWRRIKVLCSKLMRIDQRAWHELDPRITKEAVRWMYDRFSLKLIVEKAGFTEFSQKDFDKSDIPNWERYDLDQSNYGHHAIDPSVYIECRNTV